MKETEYSGNEQRSCDTFVPQRMFPRSLHAHEGEQSSEYIACYYYYFIITVVVIIIELLFNYKRSFNEYQDTWPVFPHGLYDPAGEHKMRANKAR